MKITIEVPEEFTAICADRNVKTKDILEAFMADVAETDRSHGSNERMWADEYFSNIAYMYEND